MVQDLVKPGIKVAAQNCRATVNFAIATWSTYHKRCCGNLCDSAFRLAFKT